MPSFDWPEESQMLRHFEKEWKNWDEYKAKLDNMSELEIQREIAYSLYILRRKT